MQIRKANRWKQKAKAHNTAKVKRHVAKQYQLPLDRSSSAKLPCKTSKSIRFAPARASLPGITAKQRALLAGSRTRLQKRALKKKV